MLIGEPPLTQAGCLESLKTMYSESGSAAPSHLLEAGDAYSGHRSKEANQFQDFWKAGASGNSGGNRRNTGGQSREKRDREEDNRGKRDDKRRKDNRTGRDDLTKGLCNQFNEGRCRFPEHRCNYKHKCSRTYKKNGTLVLCGESHPKTSCRH